MIIQMSMIDITVTPPKIVVNLEINKEQCPPIT